MVSSGISVHADLRLLIKSSLEDSLVGFFRSVVHDRGRPTGFQSGSYQATDLAMISILSFVLPTNPLSFSQYGRELHLV